MDKNIYAVEGIDGLGKSTLIDGIKQRLGFYQVIHFGKPEILELYSNFEDKVPAYYYQQASFRNSMLMARSCARIIFDRWHIGEAVYGPIYRKYNADYVFTLEDQFELQRADIRLILLVEDFDRSTHFISDGDSFDDSKRREEQELFIQAFNRSIIRDKRMVCVTALNGNFRPRSDILDEALGK
jgi:thymidylate kinase